jgi:hypothetical protein
MGKVAQGKQGPGELLPLSSHQHEELIGLEDAFQGDARVFDKFNIHKSTKKSLKEAVYSRLRQAGRRRSDVKYRVGLNPITESPREIGMFEVRDREKDELLGRFIIKKHHDRGEKKSLRRLVGTHGLGPDLLHIDEYISVEEHIPDKVRLRSNKTVGTTMRDRAPHLRKTELAIVGRRLAELVHTSVQEGILYSSGHLVSEENNRIYDTHLRLVGRGANIRPVLLDWSRSVDINRMREKGELKKANDNVKGFVKVLMGLVRRCANPGEDAAIWANFQLRIEQLGSMENALLFENMNKSIEEEVQDPASWGGKNRESIAGDHAKFFEDVEEAKGGGYVPVAQRTDRERLQMDLTDRKADPDIAEWIIERLSADYPPDDFRKINFKTIKNEGDEERGQFMIQVCGQEPERKTLQTYDIRPLRRGENAGLKSDMDRLGIAAPYSRFGNHTIVEYVPEKTDIKGWVDDAVNLEDADEALRRAGRGLAIVLNRMVSNDCLMKRDAEGFVDSFNVLTGDGRPRIVLGGWDRLVDSSDVKKKDRAIKDYMRAVGKISTGNRIGLRARIWYEFEKTLPATANDSGIREKYESLIKEVKVEDHRNHRLWNIVRGVTDRQEEEIPDTIKSAMEDAKVKDYVRSWDNLRQMGDYSPTHLAKLRVEGRQRKSAVAKRRRESMEILEELVGSVGKSGKDPDETIRALRVLGESYDEVSYRVNRKRMIPETGETKGPLRDKMEVYDRIKDDPLAIKALTDPQFNQLASVLKARSSYLARTLIEFVSENPGKLDRVLDLRYQPKSVHGLRRELVSFIKEADDRIEKAGLDTGKAVDLKSARRERTESVKSFYQLQVLRLGYMYTERLKQQLNPNNPDDVKAIYHNISDVSDVTLEGMLKVEEEFQRRLYGNPSTSFAIVVGGANARREFGHQDVDMIGVIGDDEGITGGGSKGKTSNKDYYEAVGEGLVEMSGQVGLHLDTDFCIEGTFAESTDYYINRLRAGIRDNPAAMFGMENLRVAVGDYDTGSELVDEGYKVTREFREQLAGAALYSREVRRKTWTGQENLKYAKGGLRDMMDVFNTHKHMGEIKPRFDEQGRVRQSSVFEMLSDISMGKTQREALMESYMWLMNVRIRLDLEYGRQHKYLPESGELTRFSRLMGYRDDQMSTANQKFMREYEKHTTTVAVITDDLLGRLIKKHPEVGDSMRKVRESIKQRQEKEMEEERNRARREEEERVNSIKDEIEAKRGGIGSFINDLWARRTDDERGN